MTATIKQSLAFVFTALFVLVHSTFGQAPIRVARAYEDTVRIAVIWNDAQGNACNNGALHQPVGAKTRDFVLKALNIAQVPNIRVLQNSTTQQVTWANIESLWGANRLPHVIVHVNAGWSTGWNTPTLQNTFTQAVNRHIGVVSVGDDAANLAQETFGFTNVDNVPAPLGDGTTIDSLWIGLIRRNDDRLKIYENGQLAYPGVNGIISNAIDSIFHVRNPETFLQFKPRNNGRCQADADRYAFLRPQWLTMLGYQQGYLNGSAQPNHSASTDLNVLVAIQDTTSQDVIRRGVAVSFQPQFLRDSVGVQQIVYDAIMFASLAHTLSVPTRLIISTDDDSITAGDIDTLSAYVIDQRGDTIYDPSTTIRIQWGISNAHSGDRYINNINYGGSVQFTATEAYRFVTVYAQLNGPNGLITDSAKIWVRPGPPHHLVIEGSSTPRNFLDDPIGGNGTVTIGASQTEARGYAVLRDQYQNLALVKFSTNTQWDTLRPNGTVSVRSGTATIGEGIFTKTGPSGPTVIRAADRPSGFADTITVTVNEIQYDSLHILQYDMVQRRLVVINSLTLPTSDSTVLYVQGLRKDRLGPPGSGGWVDVQGIWTISSNLHTNPSPSLSAQNAWGFSPTDTGHGTISVRLNGGPQTSIPAVFTTGAPRSLVLYPAPGNPATLTKHPEPQAIADSVAAGRQYTKLYAKLFDENGYWLSDYQNNTTLAQQIQWTVAPTTETSLLSTNGHSNSLRSTLAYTRVKVKATWNLLSDSVIIYIKPDTANHMVIEASPTIRDLNNDDPLQSLVIRSEQTLGYVYAILRDAYGNFVGYSNPTKWNSLATTIVTADTAITGIGEGIVLRVADSGHTKVVATDITKNFKDTVDVELQNIFYKQLRIYLLDNGPKYIDSIKVRTDEKQTLYVEGMRSDNNTWERVNAVWSASSSLKTIGNPPPSSNQWEVVPDSVGTGWIKVTLQSATPDSVFATFLPGLPGSIAIYKQKGNPLLQRPYPIPPQLDSIIAGNTAPLVVAVFDRNGIWLSSYADSVPSLSLISWTITRESGSDKLDTLSARKGYLNSLTPTEAYTTYLITATFNDGTRNLKTELRVYILPGPAHHLTIESTPNITGDALYDDKPLDFIDFGKYDTLKTAFAVIRDKFGNYVQLSPSTRWYSIDSAIATAAEGVALVGEGKVTRTAALGNTKVVAVNRLNSNLFDTVLVNINNFSYDSLKIVVDDSIQITELVMHSDKDTLLKVLGLRSYDQEWVPVIGNWTYQSTNISLNQNNQGSWLFAPGDVTHGIITVTSGTAIPAQVRVNVLPGPPASLVLYPKRGAVGPDNAAYANPPDTITVTAGELFPIVSKIFDHKTVWLPEYQNPPPSDSITWSIVELSGNDSSGVLTKKQGDSISFFPIRAYQRVYVVGKLTTSNNATFSDTVLLSIVAGKPKNLFIEGSPQVNLHHPTPVDTIRILGNMTYGSAYAILRDSIGNFNSYSKITQWGVVNNDTVISVRNGITQIGEGIISRNVRQGSAKVWASDVNGLKDSTTVLLVEYYYTQLRILVDFTPNLDSLTMLTTNDTTLRVQGLRSDSTTLWEFVDNAIWQNSSSLKMTPTAPIGRMWRFSPTDTGSGFIRVTLNNDSITKPDTLWAHFIPGPPSEIRVKIITPELQRIAGKQIQMVVELYNEDGLVKGPYDFKSVKYDDILPDGGRPRPFVLLGTDTLFLDSLSKEHFDNGIDTIPLVLFYAPSNYRDSLHQIKISMDGLSTSTERFRLYPDDLSKLVLERNEKPIGDTLVIKSTDPPVQITSIGFDKYGNRIGPIYSNWSTDSTLHPIPGVTQKIQNIFYDGTTAKDNEIGKITTVPSDTAFKNIFTNVVVKIIPPPIKLESATTGDFDGDGYLDHFILKFERPVTLPKGYPVNFVIQYGTTIFYVSKDSIKLDTSRTDSVWVISVPEEVGDSTLQTSWKPIINAEALLNIGLDSILNYVCIDGAGPVISKVTKEIVDLNDRTKDKVTITFSEAVQRFDFQTISKSDTPKVFLYVWEKDPKDSTKFILKDSMLAGITNFTEIDGKTSFTFVTSNGADINTKHFFSIKSVVTSKGDTTSFITDTTGLTAISQPNVPNPNNRQVQVRIIGNPPAEIAIFPNPATATGRHGTLLAQHTMEARNWVEQEHAGVIFGITITMPLEKDIKIKCEAKVYDVIGNLVASDVQADIKPSIEKSGQQNGIASVDIYWGGVKSNHMRVAPGVYKVIVYIDYYGSPNADKYKDERKTGVLGMAHGDVK